jgi:hypothetical protein
MSGRALLSRKQVQAERLAPESDRGRMVIATLAAYAGRKKRRLAR